MPFEAELRGPRGSSHPFSTIRRHFAESGDINDTVEALSGMLDPVEFVWGNASGPARAFVEGGPVIRVARAGMMEEISSEALEALDEWNPMTYIDRLWNSQVDQMVHIELLSAIIVCLLDLRSRTSHLGFVICHYGPQGMFGGLFQVGREHQTSVLHVDPNWEPAEIGAKLVKKMRKVGLNDWGHLAALCHMLGRYSAELSGIRHSYERIVVGLNYYDA